MVGKLRDELSLDDSSSEPPPPRTNADKRKAVMTLLEDEEWSSWPQRKIAAQCNVTQGFVSKLASGLEETASYNRNKTREVTRGETTFEMNTSNIGRRESSQPDIGGNESAPSESNAPDRLSLSSNDSEPPRARSRPVTSHKTK